ncbi:hypothetical protein HPB51_015351 [Rhipicephalus microplus]|uniref:Uncharacterized protein n=1 Tax=Rhipicephalus microplus TaxID=6941 RepID=A0A9J6DVU7_RHIMP|nr:hypothetical protein HPB51_015351 [Rhipicephalus microplus]
MFLGRGDRMVGRPAPRRAETRRPSDQAGHHTSLRRRPRLPVQARKRPHIFRPSAASSSAPINSQNSGQSPAGCTSSLPSPRLISSRFPTRFFSYPFRARYLGAHQVGHSRRVQGFGRGGRATLGRSCWFVMLRVEARETKREKKRAACRGEEVRGKESVVGGCRGVRKEGSSVKPTCHPSETPVRERRTRVRSHLLPLLLRHGRNTAVCKTKLLGASPGRVLSIGARTLPVLQSYSFGCGQISRNSISGTQLVSRHHHFLS